MITVKKFKLITSNNEVYKFIRDEQYNQYLALNLGMSLLYSNLTLNNYNSGAELKLLSQIKKLNDKLEKTNVELGNEKITDAKKTKLEKLKTELDENISTLNAQYNQAAEYRSDVDVKLKDMYIKDLYTVLQSNVNLQNKDNMSLITQRVKNDFSTALKNGMARGERSLTNYKRDYPLMTRGRDLKLTYDDESKQYTINWIKGFKFGVYLGTRKFRANVQELEKTLQRLINGEYKTCDSSIHIVDNDIILNLTMDIPDNINEEIVTGRYLGVDLGIKYPAYVCLSDDTYKRSSIGNKLELLKMRNQFKQRRTRMQEQLKLVKGGKGRDKKLKALDKLKTSESNFAKTYNHNISIQVVRFAKQHKCEYIKLEKLTKDGFNDSMLGKWGYYQLQQQIEYKAKREGIKVLYVDPAYTSQTCSRCSNVDKENRQTQDKFICTKCEFTSNADHNAAINIARSEKIIK